MGDQWSGVRFSEELVQGSVNFFDSGAKNIEFHIALRAERSKESLVSFSWVVPQVC